MFLNKEVNYSKPQRIVSLVPSQTELLFDLGLEEQVVGITKFCIHPANWLKTKTIIGGTKNVHIDKVLSLNPDLIIANKEENTKEQILELSQFVPIFVTDISNIETATKMIADIGKITHTLEKANSIVQQIGNGFRYIKDIVNKRKTLYLIWRKPWMSIGKDTFIHAVLQHIGCINVCENKSRYPELTAELITQLRPELILLSSEPYPFKEQHIQELKAIVPNAELKLVDGEMFSWYGSRLIQAPDYLQKIFSI